MGNFRNNERGELEDQIAKHSKQIFEIENENKRLEIENTSLRQELATISEQKTAGQAKIDHLEASNKTLADKLDNLEQAELVVGFKWFKCLLCRGRGLYCGYYGGKQNQNFQALVWLLDF